MAEVVKIENGRSGYLEIVGTLLSKGEEVPSRNGKTIEVRDMVIELADPFDAVPTGVRPGMNIAIGAVEALQLVGGFSDISLTCEIQPNFRNFLDGTKFYGAYGLRTRDQLPVIVDRLNGDLDTRQAIVTLWDPELDTKPGKKDYPCTTAFSFLVRDGKLNMSTFMRSNDAWWGWPYDVWQFATLQMTIARVIGVDVGTYTHHAASFHLYEAHWDVARKMLQDAPEGSPTPTLAFGDMHSGWDSARVAAETTWRYVTGTANPRWPNMLDATQKWYAETLMAQRLKTAQKNFERVQTMGVE